MSRFGGFLDGSGLPDPSDFNSSAPGVYSLEDVGTLRRLGYWPLVETRDPYYAITQFILSTDGSLKDKSANAATLTTAGFTRKKIEGPTGQPIFAAFNSAGNAYIRPADSTNLTIGTGDYTLECWVWPTGQGNNDQPLFDTRSTSNGSGGTYFGFRNSDGAIRADGNYSFGTGSVQMRQWNHIAFVRLDGQLSVYVNGAKQGNSVVSTLNHTSSTLVVGGYSYSPVGVNPFIGYIADARATIGAARYSLSSFTPPELPAPAVQEPVPPYAPTLDDSFYGDQSVALNWRNAFNGGSDFTSFDIEYSTASDMSGGTIVNVPVGGAGPYGFSSPTTFTKLDNASTVDVLIPGELEIARTNQYSIYNSAVQSAWTSSGIEQNPADTEWALGWSDECGLATKTFGSFYYLWGGGGIGSNVVNAELVMRHIPTGRIWFIKFSQWTSGGGGGFVYERREFYGCLNLPAAHTVTGLTNGTPYYFRVRANNVNGNGAYSSVAGPITPSSALPQRLIGGDVGSAPGDDPDAYKVALLLHFDGADGSTAFPDSSNANRTLSVGGDAQISTAQSAFGGGGGGTSGWDILNASYVQSVVAGTNESLVSLAFKPDGTKMYVLGFNSGAVNEYNLATAWDVSTATYSQSFGVSGDEPSPRGLAFNADGTKFYIVGDGVFVYEYAISAWDISTASMNNIFGAAEPGLISGIAFKNDGTRMYLSSFNDDTIYEYELPTAWDISTVNYVQNLSVAAQDADVTGLTFNDDGTKMYVVGTGDKDVNEYALSTAWNISTATYTQNFSVASQDQGPSDVAFKADGTRMYVVGGQNDSVYEYSLGSAGSSGSSGLFDGTDDALTISNPPNELIRWFDTDYTLECWIYPTEFTDSGSSNGRPVLVGNTDLNAGTDYWSFGPRADGKLALYYFNGSGNTVASTNALTLNQWQHIAFVHSNRTIKLFIDGVEEASASVSGTPQANAATIFNIAGLGNDFAGYIDEFRVTNTARYSTTFTPPTAPFPDPPTPPEYVGSSFKQDDYAESTALATKIFDGSLAGNTTNQWRTNNLNRSFAVDFGTTQEILRYRMWRNTNNDGTPTHWILQGSNTQSDWDNLQNNTGQSTFGSWTTIDTRTAVNLPKVTGSTPATQPYGEFVVANPDAYRYYRLFVSNVRADGPGSTTNRIFLAEMQFLAIISAPAVPTNLTGYPADEGASVVWSAVGPAITGYTIEWSDDGGATTLGTATTSAPAYNVSGLTNGSSYVFRVKATNTEGDSAFTAWSDPVVPAAGYTPIQDNILRATISASSTQISVQVMTTSGYAKLVSSTGETSSIVQNSGLWSPNGGWWQVYYGAVSLSNLPTASEKTISLISCDSSGEPSGELKHVVFGQSGDSPPPEITRIDASGCTSLGSLSVQSSTSGVYSAYNYSFSNLPAALLEIRAVGVAVSGGYLQPPNQWSPYPRSSGGINVAGQLLSGPALNQLYTDLANSSGKIIVLNNPGTAADDPTIATGKGYTVEGT